MSDKPPKRLRIAVLNRGFFSHAGGAERYSISLVEALAARHEIHVFAQHIDHQYPGVSYHKVPQCVRRPSWINLLCFNIRTWLATRKGFDIVHSHENTWHGNIQTVHVRPVKVGLFHGRHGLLRLVRYLQIATSPRLWTYLLMERCRFSNRPGRIVIATSEPLRQELETAYPSLRGRTCVLPPGVILPAPINLQEKLKLRQDLQLPENAFVMLFVGNDYAKKGLDALLVAMRRLPDHAHLLVVGNSAHIAQFSARAQALGIENQVHFIGSVSDVGPYYLMADLLAHPTTEDTFAMVVLEAMAHGLPVVVSGPQWCGIAASLHDGREARILQNPMSTEEISNTINELIQNEMLRQALAGAGRHFAEAYGWDHLAAQQELLFDRSLEISHRQQ